MSEFSGDLAADIFFVIDASESLGKSYLKNIKRVVTDVVSSFDIGANKTRVGLISFR